MKQKYKPKNWVHGEYANPKRSSEYMAWSSMIGRCCNPRNQNYKRYGALGVSVCERWRHSYLNFLADVGRKPSPIHSLDRYPDPYGNYGPGNVRWALPKQQSRNRRNNHRLEYNGDTKTLVEWAERTGIGKQTLRLRLKRGWSIEDTLTKPVIKS